MEREWPTALVAARAQPLQPWEAHRPALFPRCNISRRQGEWRNLNFGAQALAAEAQAAADFEGAGTPNLMEYALDSDAAARRHGRTAVWSRRGGPSCR